MRHNDFEKCILARFYAGFRAFRGVCSGGRGPLAIHRLLAATEGIFWARRPGDGYPVPLEALKRVPCIPPAPEEASGLPAWACVRRKRGTGG